jgi:hypothetical protein
MYTIRKNVFETNSSMTHSLVLCKKSDYEKWGDDYLFCERKTPMFLETKEARKENAKYLEKMLNGNWASRFNVTAKNIDKYESGQIKLSFFNDIHKEYGCSLYLTPEEWDEAFVHTDYRSFEDMYASGTFGGVDVVAFGYHGYDG